MTTICFITRQSENGVGRQRDGKQDLDLSEGQTLFTKPVCRLWSFQFCRILTEVGGMYKKKKVKQPRAPCTQSCCGLIKCTFIIVYYDDDMTECTEDDWRYLNSVDLFFFNLLLGNSIRMLKSLLLSLLLWLSKWSSSLHSAEATFV